MSPAQAKQKQHKRYDAVAVQVARGRAGYKPAVKVASASQPATSLPMLSPLPESEL